MTAAASDDPTLAVLIARIERERSRKRNASFFGLAVFLALFLAAAWSTGFSPQAIGEGLPKFGAYLDKLFSTPAAGGGSERIAIISAEHLFDDADTKQSLAYWFYNLKLFLTLILETTLMAVVASAVGFAIAFTASFPASRNLMSSRATVFLVRRFLEVLRSIPDLVFALFFVFCYGIGPLAGILAMALHSGGALGKLFSELNENASMRPVEGIRASGGNWLETIRYAVVPQVLPGFLSYALLRFEINIRSSAIIGVVGAGGIGEEIKKVINFNRYEDISAVLILVVLLVIAIDMLSGLVRHRLIGNAARH